MRAYLGLGSNLGDRAATLDAAVRALCEARGIRLTRRSSLYETAPVGVVDQPWFLNAVVEIETELAPRALLDLARSIEMQLGRRPGRRWGERLIDVDLLWFDGATVDEPDLVVPHREMWRRLFVLAPLAELRPDLQAPDGRRIDLLIGELAATQDIRPVAVRSS